MKQKLFLPILLIAVLFSACKKESTNDKQSEHSDSVIAVIHGSDSITIAKTSIDWEGEYKGILPCEDCDGMEISLTLNFDYTFSQSISYIGKGGPYESQGNFEWGGSENIIVLKFEDGSQAKYLVSEEMITLLDENGERQGDEYVLRK